METTPGPEYKCSVCKRILPASSFSKGRNKSGLRSICKECVHKAYEADKDRILAKHKAYYEQNKEKFLETCRQYRESHAEERKQYFAEYYQNNADVIKERTHNAYLNMTEKEAERRMNYYHTVRRTELFKRRRAKGEQDRREKARISGGSLLESEWNENLMQFDNSCAYCGAKGKMTRDHIVPLSKGGGYSKNNIVPCCTSCNSKKHNRDMQEWYQKQPFFDASRLQKILTVMEGR